MPLRSTLRGGASPQALPFALFSSLKIFAQQLPLVTVGDSDYVEHDWFHIFSSLGLLQHDTQIAAFVRLLGWVGMLATIAWLAWRWKQSCVSET